MRSLSLLVSLFLFSTLTAQKEAAIWYFGENAGLDFNSGNPVALTDGALWTREGCATISDAAGNLLFYTDGEEVWNRNHNIMPNGSGLLGDFSSTQSAIVVPRPGFANRYYIFTVDERAEPDGLRYSEVDMTLDAGMGDITGTKNVLLVTPVTEKLTAVEHANGQDIWVLTHGWENNRFYAYLVTDAGVDPTPVITDIGLVHIRPANINYGAQQAGYLKASPDGSKIAAVAPEVGLDLFDFNNATGELSNHRNLILGQSYYGLEFSPSSRYLYTAKPRSLLQFDTQAVDIPASAVEILPSTGGDRIWGMQLGIDGKIYVTNEFEPFLSRIENPDNPGLSCNLVLQAVDLAGRNGRLGLPPFIQSYFLISFSAENLCFGEATTFNLNSTEPVLSAIWDFGDGSSSTLESPLHTYAAPGTYTVQVTVQTASETKTETRDITITSTPTAHPIANIDECHLQGTYTLQLSTLDSQVLGSQQETDFQVTYHNTQADADSGILPLTSPYSPTITPETIYVRVAARENPQCYSTRSFSIRIKEGPQLLSSSDWNVCDTDTDGIYTFDLEEKDAEVLGAQDPTAYEVFYYATQTDADTGMNSLPNPYINSAPNETIYFRIQNEAYPECFETGSFDLSVFTEVQAIAPQIYRLCDTDNDGFAQFDLTTLDEEILGPQDPTSFIVSYYAALSDAEADLNRLPVNYTNANAYSENIYARVTNIENPDCYNTTSVLLEVNNSPQAGAISRWLVCDSGNDGVESFDLRMRTYEVLGNQSSSEYQVRYYLSQDDADLNNNAITEPIENTSNPQTIFYRILNNNNIQCYVIGEFELEVLPEPVANTPTEWVRCDSEGTGGYSWDLSQIATEILGNQDPAVFTLSFHQTELDALGNAGAIPGGVFQNQNATSQLWARLTHAQLETCYSVTPVSLIVNPLPQPLIEKQYVICPDSPELILDGGEFESWNWQLDGTTISNERILDVENLGNYSLTVSETSFGVQCEKTITFEVVSSGAPETIDVEVGSLSDQVEVLILATGIGQFEYSIDGTTWQDANRFTVFPGSYTVYVRDPFECRVLSEPIVAIGYSRFFTPNGDNTNETWHIIGAQEFPDSRLQIFDRYGQLMASLSPDDSGWDGRVSGRLAPPSDYWFRYEYGEGKVLKGHFTLKR